MNIPDAATLRQAIVIATKIESLQEELCSLLAAGNSHNKEETCSYNKETLTISTNSRRRGRPSKNNNDSFLINEQAARSKKQRRPSSLKGKPRASSPSGPLGPAVLKVLEEKGEPMKVSQIFQALEKDNYQWTARDPLQTLYIRMPKLKGIVRVEDGKYEASGVPIVPAKRGRKAKKKLPLGEEAVIPTTSLNTESL